MPAIVTPTCSFVPICHLLRDTILCLLSQVMLHQPSGGANGMAADIAIAAEEIIKTRARLNEMYAKHTGRVSASPFCDVLCFYI